MITKCGIRQLKLYCREPIENIKGYREAVESKGRYDCHHINELTFTKDELKKMNMYYNRPASELVIMTDSEHRKWHRKWNRNPMSGMTGYKNPMYGRSRDLSPRWIGDKASHSTIYKRALKLYKAGKISEDELQPFRDMWIEYKKMRNSK